MIGETEIQQRIQPHRLAGAKDLPSGGDILILNGHGSLGQSGAPHALCSLETYWLKFSLLEKSRRI